MSLIDLIVGGSGQWSRVGDRYAVTKKPRGLNPGAFSTIPFITMESVPQDGGYDPVIEQRSPAAIASGTYFERGDLLVAKITPSFENGKQALVRRLPSDFGYATTEVIPLRAAVVGEDARFLFFYLLHPDIRHHVAERMEGSTGRRRVPEDVLLDLPLPAMESAEQSDLADALERIQDAISIELTSGTHAADLKRSAMHALFTRGLRGEEQKETEIGMMPETWKALRLDSCAEVVTSRMSYSELEATIPSSSSNAIEVHGIKVSDMNRPGNEIVLHYSALTSSLERHSAERRSVPPNTIIFPKRGAAIATNKKRLTSTWTVFDPNIIGVRAGSVLDARFLFHWFQRFDLRTITEPGPTPQLNKKNLDPLLIPVPPTLDEQRAIVDTLDAIDRKINLHREKRGVLDELFKSLLHKLMTGEIRVNQLALSSLAEAPATAMGKAS